MDTYFDSSLAEGPGFQDSSISDGQRMQHSFNSETVSPTECPYLTTWFFQEQEDYPLKTLSQK